MPDEFAFDRLKNALETYRIEYDELLDATDGESSVGVVKEHFKNYLTALEALRIASADVKYWPWILKKKLQSFARTRLSHYVSLSLVAIVIYRERREIWDFLYNWNLPDFDGWLILVGLIGTFIAAKLELWHNKRTTSPQEMRFQFNFGELLKKLHELANMNGSTKDVEKRFVEFVTTLLQLAADTFSVGSKVETGLMVPLADGGPLKLDKWSQGANYDPDLTVPIPSQNDASYKDTGPAGLAFATKRIVYLPRKEREELRNVWPIKWVDNRSGDDYFRYRPLRPQRCWRKSERPEQEAFLSVLCVPVEKFGVLNFSTEELDPLIERDFHMAQCFASVLGQAFRLLETGRLVEKKLAGSARVISP